MKIYIHVTESVNLAHTLCWRDICCVTALLFVRPSVCMSVCLSVTSRYCIETTGRIELVFGMQASFYLSYTVL